MGRRAGQPEEKLDPYIILKQGEYVEPSGCRKETVWGVDYRNSKEA